MPAADYQLFVVDLRAVTQDNPALAFGVSFNTQDTVDGDLCPTVNPHKAVAKLSLQ